MRKTNCILIIVAILEILFVFSLFNKEGIVINVNSRNKINPEIPIKVKPILLKLY